jgi:hypothetical protein
MPHFNAAVKLISASFLLLLHRSVVPVGALFAMTLWMGNAAYMYLSVSFIQMMKVSIFV